MLKEEWKRRQDLVEAHLLQELDKGIHLSDTLHDSMKYSLMAGGKRLRPVLLMASADAVGGEGDRFPPNLRSTHRLLLIGRATHFTSQISVWIV